MKIEDQVCSLTQAQELLKLGVRCESLWSWEIDTGEIVHDASGCPVPDIYIPAYTCAELGVMLQIVDNNLSEGELLIYPYEINTIRFAKRDSCGNEECIEAFKGATEAQARSSALIWLIKEGHIKAEEVKL